MMVQLDVETILPQYIILVTNLFYTPSFTHVYNAINQSKSQSLCTTQSQVKLRRHMSGVVLSSVSD